MSTEDGCDVRDPAFSLVATGAIGFKGSFEVAVESLDTLVAEA
jgi:hypothetical protein